MSVIAKSHVSVEYKSVSDMSHVGAESKSVIAKSHISVEYKCQ